MNNILLTIIIPVYGGAKYLKGIIKNVFEKNKSFFNQIELLFVDDGSKDDSLKVLKELQSIYPNVSCYHKENGGIASARELGLQKCSGKYFTFIDQDDTVVKSYQSFIDALEANHADFIMTNHLLKYSDGKVVISNMGLNKDMIVCGEDIKEFLVRFISSNLSNLQHFYGIDLSPTVWNCIFSTECMRKNNIHFIRFVNFEDDWLFIVQFLSVSKKMILAKDYYYCWTINAESESHSKRYIPNIYEKKKKLLDWILDKQKNLGVSEEKMLLYRKRFVAHIVVESFLSYSYFLPYKQYINEMSKIKEIDDDFLDFDLKRTKNFFKYLLRYRLFGFAYFVNHYILKKV